MEQKAWLFFSLGVQHTLMVLGVVHNRAAIQQIPSLTFRSNTLG